MRHFPAGNIALWALLPLCVLSLLACGGGGGGGDTRSPPAPTEPTTPRPPEPARSQGFIDFTGPSGIGFELGFIRRLTNEEAEVAVPSGVAAGDYDDDGLIDLVVVRGDAGGPLIYRNLGDLRFEEVSSEAGIALNSGAGPHLRLGSPGLADLDGDGDLDLFLPGMGHDPSNLYRNNGDGTFSNVTPGSGFDLIESEFSFSPAFGDYDLDGDLDMLLAHWGTERDRSKPAIESEHLWRNDSDEVGMLFTAVTLATGLAPSIVAPDDPLITQKHNDYSFSPSFARINEDRYPDILMVADFNHTQVFHNRLDGTFENVTDFGVIIDGNGMGSALGDYDGDGDLDWFVSSIRATASEAPDRISSIGNRLYRNEAGVFSDVTDISGTADGGWGWGSCFMDFENDGDLDIYHTNGWPVAEEYGAFLNDASRAFVSDGQGRFEEKAGELGLDDTYEGRGVICADLDNDGDVDILQLHNGTAASATLWRNDSQGNGYLAVKLRGEAPNTGAVGARIRIHAGGRDQMREVILGNNYLSQNPTDQYFGLGTAERIETLTVEWPDGSETLMQDIEANQHLTIDHPRK